MKCYNCNAENKKESKFCNQCGINLEDNAIPASLHIKSERKQATILFSDLSGYTALSETLDPEEGKEIISNLFSEITKVINKYEGTVDKFIGDAVMALFGVPITHEDDPVRAIKAALEINQLVEGLSSQFEEIIGKRLTMHTGINTGLVVTGESDFKKGTEKVIGDTVNLASRLTGLAKNGEVLIGEETYRQSERYFEFEALKPIRVKGKVKKIASYKVLAVREKPIAIHRFSGLKADFIGRKNELDQLKQSAKSLMKGKGTVISICGEAGTGKSRILKELKTMTKLTWKEGYAYAYSKDIPYFPVVDLISREFGIEEKDTPKKVKKKIESNIEWLLGKKGKNENSPYVGSLFSIKYPETDGLDPELWKQRWFKAVKTIMIAMVKDKRSVVCLEDLHWADDSTIELLNYIVPELGNHSLFMYTCRSPVHIFDLAKECTKKFTFKEIYLGPFSQQEMNQMLNSLLKSNAVPKELHDFISQKVQGNPFYLEEVVNCLVECNALSCKKNKWVLSKTLGEINIPTTIEGVIATRIDNLNIEKKRALQEASVIGRAFHYEIIKHITSLSDNLDESLNGLEDMGFIDKMTFEPDLEFIFKHALIQEVAYNELLKKERQEIHKKVALTMEKLFASRLFEFYEALALHYTKGGLLYKAVDFLFKSGQKNLKQYALEESHRHYRQGYELLINKSDKTKKDYLLIIDLINEWSKVFYFSGNFTEQLKLMQDNLSFVESVGSKTQIAAFYGWFSMTLWGLERYNHAYKYAQKCYSYSEKAGDKHTASYAYALLSVLCAEMGPSDKAIYYAEQSQQTSQDYKSDQLLGYLSLMATGQAYFLKGQKERVYEVSKALLEYGEKNSDIRSLTMGYHMMGFSHIIDDDYPSALIHFEQAIGISTDPFYSQFNKLWLGFCYSVSGDYIRAEEYLQEVIAFSESSGSISTGGPAKVALGAVFLATGKMSKGLKLIKDTQSNWLENKCIYRYVTAELGLGNIYLNILQRTNPVGLPLMIKNIGFIVKNIPFSGRKAEKHLKKAVKVSEEIGAWAILGQSYLHLGRLYSFKGRRVEAKKCLVKAASLFKDCKTKNLLNQAEKELANF